MAKLFAPFVSSIEFSEIFTEWRSASACAVSSPASTGGPLVSRASARHGASPTRQISASTIVYGTSLRRLGACPFRYLPQWKYLKHHRITFQKKFPIQQSTSMNATTITANNAEDPSLSDIQWKVLSANPFGNNCITLLITI